MATDIEKLLLASAREQCYRFVLKQCLRAIPRSDALYSDIESLLLSTVPDALAQELAERIGSNGN